MARKDRKAKKAFWPSRDDQADDSLSPDGPDFRDSDVDDQQLPSFARSLGRKGKGKGVSEAVLLVEPLATVAALEAYIADKFNVDESLDARGVEASRARPSTAPPSTSRPARERGASIDGDDRPPGTPTVTVQLSPRFPGGGPDDEPLDPPAYEDDEDETHSQPPERVSERQRVELLFQSRALASSSTIIQCLVSQYSQSASSPSSPSKSDPAPETGRFLVNIEDGEQDDPGSMQRSVASPVWSCVHSFTFKVVPVASAKDSEQAANAGACEVATGLDSLVRNLGKAPEALRGLEDDAGDAQQLNNLVKLVVAAHQITAYARKNLGMLDGLPDDNEFQSTALTAKMLRQLSDPLAVATLSIPKWCTAIPSACPALVPFLTRRALYQTVSLGVSRALHHLTQRLTQQAAFNTEQSRRLENEVQLSAIPRQKVRISRDRLGESALKVMEQYGATAPLLEVEYIGEVGTGSGPTLEFYALIADAMKNSTPRMFREVAVEDLLFPHPYKEAPAHVLSMFRLLGQTVAKCMLDGRLVDLHLHPLFWGGVLGHTVTEMDLADVDPMLHKSLASLRKLSAQDLEATCLDFCLPGDPTFELVPDGANVPVTVDNLELYIKLVFSFVMVDGVKAQVDAFSKAFQRLLDLSVCKPWSLRELPTLVLGASPRDSEFWTIEHLASYIRAQHGYSAHSPRFNDLLHCLAKYTPEKRRKFLQFCTGSPTLPINGFAGLRPPLTVVKKEPPPAPLSPDSFLPSVMTCANYLKLPEYSSAEHLERQIDTAICEGQSAFHLS